MSKINILFDLDGTLVNTLPDIAGVVNRVRGQRSLAPLAAEEVRRHIGRGAENLVAGTFPEVPAAHGEALLSEFYRSYYETPPMGGAVYPGVREGLLRLRTVIGLKLAVATNKPSLAADRTIADYLPGFVFDEVAGPERVSAKKPSPRHLLDVIERLHLKPKHCYFIGDDQIDYDAASAAGVAFLGAGYGFGFLQAPEAIMLSSFSELFDKIPGLAEIC